MKKKLNKERFPDALLSLFEVVEKWGIPDDCERDAAVKKASREELEQLIHSIDSISDDALYGWLAGPESFSSNPSSEYVAITCFTMAIDMAKLVLNNRKMTAR